MIHLNPHRLCCGAFAAVASLCLSGCAVPLAPGYRIEKQSITVRFVPGTPPHLAVRAEYRLANAGNGPLDSIEVGLPDQKSFGRENLRVQVNGKDVAPQIARGEEAEEGESSASDAWPAVFRIPFSPAWPRKHRRNLVIEYDLTAAMEPHLRMYVSPTMFYLNDSGWFPDPLASKSFLAKDVVRPDPSDLTVIVPKTFLATGSGEPRGARKSGAETEYRFRLRKDDFDPFVIAGQYHEQRVSTSAGSVVFWTFKPLAPANAQAAGAQIASKTKFYAQTFGPLPRSMTAIYDVTLPEVDARTDANLEDYSGMLLPGVAYEWRFNFRKDSASLFRDALSSFSEQLELGWTWFGHLMRPRPEASVLANALNEHTAELRGTNLNGGAARSEAIATGLEHYDRDRAGVVEKPILSLTPRDAENQRQIGRDKLVLFLYALEDKCGRDNLNRALAHMVSALRFQQYGYDDFRSAVEEECHQDLGPFFRSWLNEKGIPADFRAKYEPALQNKN